LGKAFVKKIDKLINAALFEILKEGEPKPYKEKFLDPE